MQNVAESKAPVVLLFVNGRERKKRQWEVVMCQSFKWKPKQGTVTKNVNAKRPVEIYICVPHNKMRKEHQYNEDVFYKKKLQTFMRRSDWNRKCGNESNNFQCNPNASSYGREKATINRKIKGFYITKCQHIVSVYG